MLSRVLTSVAAVAVATAMVACGSGSAETTAPSSRDGATSSNDALARLKADANRLLEGGPDAFKARLAELRGHPVVVNQWA
jgi:hypothetical protein